MGVFVSCRYTKSLGAAVANAKYIAFRSREVGEMRDAESWDGWTDTSKAGAFGPDYDHADVENFCKRLKDNLTKNPNSAKAHKLIFSLSGDEYRRGGSPDWRSMIRSTMSKYEERTGHKLEWIAAVHNNRQNSHCHVLVKSVYKDQQGQKHRLKLDKNDWTNLRKDFYETWRDHRVKRTWEREQLPKEYYPKDVSIMRHIRVDTKESFTISKNISKHQHLNHSNLKTRIKLLKEQCREKVKILNLKGRDKKREQQKLREDISREVQKERER